MDGYVLKSDLEDANGTTAMNGFTSPEDAILWQEAEGGKVHTIPVYLTDGTTVIGTFTVGGGTGDPATLPPLGQ